MAIYLNINQQQAGPYEIDSVNQMISLNQITFDTLGWMDGMANWQPLSSPTFSTMGIGSTVSAESTQNRATPPHDNNSVIEGGGTISIGSAFGEAFGFFKANVVGAIAWLVITGLLGSSAIGAFLIPLVGVNFFACAKRFRENGKKMDLGELFDFTKFVEKILGPIILGFIIGVGFLCLVIPGIIFSMWWTFSPCVLADRPSLSFTDAMKTSRNVAKGNWIKIILLFLCTGLLQVIGAICLGIGLLVTIPVGHLAMYYAYQQAKK